MWTDLTTASAVALVWLLAVTIGFLWLPRPAADGGGRWRLAAVTLPILLLIAAVARLVPALILPTGATYDIESFRMVTDALLGGQEVYSASLGRHPYLPFQMFIMGAMALLSRGTGLPYVVAIKLPAIAADVAIAGAIYIALMRGGVRRETAVYFGLLYALNPVSLVVSAYHGQFEAVTLLLMTISWFFWEFDRHTARSGTALGLAILNKTWPIITLPVMLMRQPGWRPRLLYGGLAVGVPLVFTALYLAAYSADPQVMLGRALTHRGVPGYWGPSALLAPLGRFSAAAQGLFDALVAIRNWLLAAAILFALWQTRHRDALHAQLAVILSVLAVTVGFGNQWLLWPLPFALLARQDRPARWYSLAALLMMIVHLYGANMVGWLPRFLPGEAGDWVFRLSALPCWGVVVVWTLGVLFPGAWDRRRLAAAAPSLLRWGALGLIAAALLSLTQTQADVSDPVGYLYAGQRLAEGNGLSFEDPYNEVAGPYFVPYAFQVSRPGDAAHYLGFPPGFPILLAGGSLAGADARAATYVVPLLAVLSLVATYYLGRYLSGDRSSGIWAAGVLAATVGFWQFGTAAWSEVPAMLAVAAGSALFLRSRLHEAHRTHFALLAAAVLSFGTFVRYTNIAFLGALAVYDLWTARRAILTERWRWTFWATAAVGVAAIPVFNHFYYGGALVTSYSPLHGWYPSPPFALAYALGPSFVNGYSLRESLKALWQNFPVTLLLSPVGLALLPGAARVLAGAAIVLGLLPYTVYAFAPAGINSRFLLPLFPFLAVAIGHLIASILRRLRRPWVQAGVALGIAVGLLLPAAAQWDDLRTRNKNSAATVALVRDLTDDLEPEAVVLSYVYNDLVIVYGDRSALNYRRIPASDPALGRYRLEMLEPCLVGSINRLLARSVPVYYFADAQPPYWDSLAILQRHFRLTELAGNVPTYRIEGKLDGPALDESMCGFPQSADRG